MKNEISFLFTLLAVVSAVGFSAGYQAGKADEYLYLIIPAGLTLFLTFLGWTASGDDASTEDVGDDE